MRHLIRKGPIHVYVEYGRTFTNNLTIQDTRVSDDEGEPTLSVHLRHKLRTRDKSTDFYDDEHELAESDLAQLRLLQISESSVAERILEHLSLGRPWALRIALEGYHTFSVRPEYKERNLILRVVSDKDFILGRWSHTSPVNWTLPPTARGVSGEFTTTK